MKYSLAALGGTFDRLHRGHREFLKFAFSKSENLIIGLTSDEYVGEHKKTHEVLPYANRKQMLEKYLSENGFINRFRIIQINDYAGPLLTNEFNVDVIIVTSDSKSSADKINSQRVDMGLEPLLVEVFNLILLEDKKTPVSSSIIRDKVLRMPEKLRILLQAPFGDVLDEIPEGVDVAKTITVGDFTTKRFLDAGLKPRLVIIDHKIERKHVSKILFTDRNIFKVKNFAGTIAPELIQAIKESLENHRNCAIEVDGEEDLAVLPVIKIAPLGHTVYYGQPYVGLVEVSVTRLLKEKAQKLLRKFDTND